MHDADLCSLLLRALRYEHWLRFYFMADIDVSETDGAEGGGEPDAELRVPEEWIELARREEAELFPMLEALQGRPLSMEESRDAVFRHVARSLGRDSADPAFGEDMFALIADPEFRRGLDAFHGWVQEIANGEEDVPASHSSGVPLFREWEHAFRAWTARQAIQRVTSITPYAAKPEESKLEKGKDY